MLMESLTVLHFFSNKKAINLQGFLLPEVIGVHCLIEDHRRTSTNRTSFQQLSATSVEFHLPILMHTILHLAKNGRNELDQSAL